MRGVFSETNVKNGRYEVVGDFSLPGRMLTGTVIEQYLIYIILDFKFRHKYFVKKKRE